MNFEQRQGKANSYLTTAKEMLEEYKATKNIDPDILLNLWEDYDRIKDPPLLPEIRLHSNFGKYTIGQLKGCLDSIKGNLEAFVKMPIQYKNTIGASDNTQKRWRHILSIVFNSYRAPLFLIGILLIFAPYMYNAISISNHWKQLQPELAEAKSILAEVDSVSKDTTAAVGKTNAVIECFNVFYKKRKPDFKPLPKLNTISDKAGTLNKKSDDADDRITFIRTELRSFINGYTIDANIHHSFPYQWLDIIFKIAGFLLDCYMVYLTYRQLKVQEAKTK